MTGRTFLGAATAVALVALLNACAMQDIDADAAGKMANSGSEFNKALQKGYAGLAQAERSEGDYDDAAFFVAKAKATTGAAMVAPQPIAERALADKYKAPIQAALTDLETAFGRGAREAKPGPAAEAQVAFDCWLQEAEEDLQPADIKACQDRFTAAIAQARMPAPMAAAPAPAPAPARAAMPMPAPIEVMFASGNAVGLDGSARKLNTAALSVIDLKLNAIVKGYTDTVGDAEANMSLAQKRAEWVANQLKLRSVKDANIVLEAYGEGNPKVATADNTAEQANRRVTIEFVPAPPPPPRQGS